MGDVPTMQADRRLDRRGILIPAEAFLPSRRGCRFDPDDPDNLELVGSYRRVGRMRERLQCLSCGAILMPDHSRRAWVGPDFGKDELDAHWVDFPEPAKVAAEPARDDVYTAKPVDAPGLDGRPRMDFAALEDEPANLAAIRRRIAAQDRVLRYRAAQEPDTPERIAERERVAAKVGATRRRLGVEGLPRRTPTTPSRSPEARHREYMRRKARQRGQSVPMTARETAALVQAVTKLGVNLSDLRPNEA